MSLDPAHLIIALLGALTIHFVLFNKWTLPFITRLITTKKQRQSYAYHEAGHALAILLLDCGKTLKAITLKPSLYVQGKVICDEVQDELTIEQAQNWLICEFAGEAAENILAGTHGKKRLSARRDKRIAKKIARRITEHNGEAIGTILKTAEDAAYQLLEQNREKLENIANALQEQETLSAEDIKPL